MKQKYGTYTQEQMAEYKDLLHKKIHWLLIYKEQDYPKLDSYFSSLLFQISGLNQLIESPQIIVLMTLLEAARLEDDFQIYRKAVLDAHSVIDLLPETDGDADE